MKQAFRLFSSIWNRSIQRQLILGIALVHAILMTIFVTDLVSRQRSFLNQQNVMQTKALAESLAANSVSWVLSDDIIGLEEVIDSQKNYPNIEYAMILSARGRVLAHTDNSSVGLYIQDPVSLGLLEGAPSIRYLVNNKELVDIGIPIVINGKHIGWSRVALSKVALQNSLQKILRDGIGYTFAAILIGSLFAVFMSRGITKGLRALVKATRFVENGKTDVRVNENRHDEIGYLSKSFNQMIGTIRQSISNVERSRLLAMKEKEKAETYLNTALVAFLALDIDGRIVLVNPHCRSILEYSREELIGKEWITTCVPEKYQHDQRTRLFEGISTDDISKLSTQCYVLPKSGETRIMDWKNTFLYDAEGHVSGVLCSGIDITEKKRNEDELLIYRNQLEELVTQRTSELEQTKKLLEQEIENQKKAEKQIKESLKEKETLLQEIHHRVKNNLTVISSLLSNQARRIDDEQVKAVLQDSQARVQAMSAIHETLYQSENLSSIDMNSYISSLAKMTLENYQLDYQPKIAIESENITLSVKQASPIGLIVNELLSNSLKYAFPGDRSGKINIKFQRSNRHFILQYWDNGVGMPDGFDWRNSNTLGLHLVRLLGEEQLGGTVELYQSDKTLFVIKYLQDEYYS